MAALVPDIEMAGSWDACTQHHLLTHAANAGVDFPNKAPISVCRKATPRTRSRSGMSCCSLEEGVLTAARVLQCRQKLQNTGRS